MPRPRPPYLVRQTTRHAKTVWYVRIGAGPRVRIHAAFGSPEFAAEYQAAVQSLRLAPAPKGSGSLEWLIKKYMESSAWAALGTGTRYQRGFIYRSVIKQAGDVPFVSVTRAKIIEGREKRQAAPYQANHFVKAMRSLFRWAIDVEIAKVDPTRDVPLLSAKGDGFHV
jgi:hypothetical protein